MKGYNPAAETLVGYALIGAIIVVCSAPWWMGL